MALYIPFVLLFPHDFGWILLILFLSLLTEFIGVIAQAIGASRRYDGPIGKSDRAFIFGTFGLLVALFPKSLLLTGLLLFLLSFHCCCFTPATTVSVRP